MDKTSWQIWCQDNFDFECPRQVVHSGIGMKQGLVELWMRHLYETIRPEGLISYTRFNLWCESRKCSIQVVGIISGQIKLREWVYGNRQADFTEYVEIADRSLFEMIAITHHQLFTLDQTSESIVDAAGFSASKDDFILWLTSQISD